MDVATGKPSSEELHDRIAQALQQDDDEALRRLLEDYKAADVAEVLDLLEDLERSRVMFALDSAKAAEVVVMLDEAVRGEVVDELPRDRLVELLTELPADDAADVVGELTGEQSDRLLKQLSVEQSRQIGRLLEYDEATAGGLMNPKVPRVPNSYTVREAIQYLWKAQLADDEVHLILVINTQGRLCGTISPQKLLISSADVQLSKIMDPDPLTITADADQEHVLQLFRKYDLMTLPVVDASNKPVGQITVDDVMDVAAEEADEDMYHMAGTDAAELETSSAFRAARIRFVWLLPPFVFMTGTACVVLISEGYFETQLLTALIAFVPMIGALAGSCSVQSATIITRGMATGELVSTRLGVVFAREGRIALVMAPLCALVAWLVVWLAMPGLQSFGHVAEAVEPQRIANAVGLGMLTAIVLASCLGILMPFLFRRMGIDPAISAGPLVTTANDVLCVTVYLVLSHMLLQG